jgi:hypothetical protein
MEGERKRLKCLYGCSGVAGCVCVRIVLKVCNESHGDVMRSVAAGVKCEVSMFLHVSHCLRGVKHSVFYRELATTWGQPCFVLLLGHELNVLQNVIIDIVVISVCM